MRGLLGEGLGRNCELTTSNGRALKAPASFADLYHVFGESWRVDGRDPALCEDKPTPMQSPVLPFYASDLDPALFEKGRAACVAKGVAGEALLDACTLDVTVLDDRSAANVFSFVRPPRVVIRPIAQELR